MTDRRLELLDLIDSGQATLADRIEYEGGGLCGCPGMWATEEKLIALAAEVRRLEDRVREMELTAQPEEPE
jgi:hypothetical protein